MIKINIVKDKDYDFGFNIDILAKKIAKKVFLVEKVKYDTSLNLSIVKSATIKKINRDNRGIDKVTDVLSFPNIDFDRPSNIKKYVSKGAIDVSIVDLNTKTIFLGDIMMCYDKVISQSNEYGHSVKREFSFLLAHSLLHLLGYDHEKKNDEKRMFAKQEMILKSLNIVR